MKSLLNDDDVKDSKRNIMVHTIINKLLLNYDLELLKQAFIACYNLYSAALPKGEEIDFNELKKTYAKACYFIDQGAIFKIKFNNSVPKYVDNIDGMKYIKQLLKNPNKKIHVSDLYNIVKGTPIPKDVNKNVLDDYNIHESFYYEKTNKKKISEYEKNLKKIKDEKEKLKKFKESDCSNINPEDIILKEENLNEEEDKYKKAIKELGKNDLNGDKLRVNIKKRINSAIKIIKKENSNLADHLYKNISTGFHCIYQNLEYKWICN